MKRPAKKMVEQAIELTTCPFCHTDIVGTVAVEVQQEVTGWHSNNLQVTASNPRFKRFRLHAHECSPEGTKKYRAHRTTTPLSDDSPADTHGGEGEVPDVQGGDDSTVRAANNKILGA